MIFLFPFLFVKTEYYGEQGVEKNKWKLPAAEVHYIHNNPVSGKWRLASSSTEYLHSLAGFYYNGLQREFEVVDYEKLLDWDGMYKW